MTTSQLSSLPVVDGRPGAAHMLTALPDRLARAAELGSAWPQLLAAGSVEVTGSGGSFPAAAYVAELARAGGHFAAAVKPLEVSGHADQLVAISYSGRTPDIGEAIRRARAAGCRRVVLLTGRPDAALAAHADLTVTHRDGGGVHGDPERGFLSFAGTLAPACAAAAAAAGEPVLPLLPPPSDTSAGWVAHLQARPREVLDVVATGWGWPAALDVESKWTEAGLGPVRLHQSKDLSHGRYLSVFDRLPRPLVLHLRTGALGAYEDTLQQVLGRHARVLTLTAADGPAGALGLLQAVAHLAAELGAFHGVDVSRPRHIPADGPDLYDWAWPAR